MNRNRMLVPLISQELGEVDFVEDEDISVPYVEFEGTVEPAGSSDVWKAAKHLELELERVERTVGFGVLPTKTWVKALAMNKISISEGMERTELRMKWPWGEGGQEGMFRTVREDRDSGSPQKSRQKRVSRRRGGGWFTMSLARS